MTLEDRLSVALGPFPTTRKRMFGGLCFMLNGNMLMGTFRRGLMARVAKEDHEKALKISGASEMVMKDRVMQGFILIDADSVEDDKALQQWVDLAMVYNATLPTNVVKPKKKAGR